MENMDLRSRARAANIPLWEIADRMGISEPTMTRLLRHKVDQATRERFLAAIREIRAERRQKAYAIDIDTE